MKLLKLSVFVVLSIIVAACGHKSGQQTPVANRHSIEVRIYHTYTANECIEWFREALIRLQNIGLMDTMKITTSGPGFFARVPDDAKEIIDRELSNSALPKEVCWDWIRYWNRSDSIARTWDLVVYECTPLLTDTVNAMEDQSIDSYPQLVWKFNDPYKFAEITRNHIGRSLALAINGRIVMAPTVNNEIESGTCAVGAITREELMNYLSE